MWIRDPVWEKFGTGMEKRRIRDKHTGCATLATFEEGKISFFSAVYFVQFFFIEALSGSASGSGSALT
jgi:hypothetical protein